MMGFVKIRFYENPETDEPHIYDHEVGEDEVLEVLLSPGEDPPDSKQLKEYHRANQ